MVVLAGRFGSRVARMQMEKGAWHYGCTAGLETSSKDSSPQMGSQHQFALCHVSLITLVRAMQVEIETSLFRPTCVPDGAALRSLTTAVSNDALFLLHLLVSFLPHLLSSVRSSAHGLRCVRACSGFLPAFMPCTCLSDLSTQCLARFYSTRLHIIYPRHGDDSC